MTWIADATLEHLRRVADVGDLGPRYRVIEALGQGGMGTVYRVFDVELGREVALKVLREPAPDPSAAERLWAEARVIAGLDHPGIAAVHDVGKLSDGRVYYVMKLIRGESLDRHINGTWSLNDRLRVFERVCETVAFAHEHGVIHRDLKPQNIMVGKFGEVLVVDWGVAKLLAGGAQGLAGGGSGPASDADRGAGPHSAHESITGDEAWDPQRTQTLATAKGTIIGTPAFMAPEQARGDVERIDQRTDVFALGAILYFLMTGSSPLDRSAFQGMRAGEWHGVETPRRGRRGIPRALAAICLKAMQPEPQERYTGAKELNADVSRYLGGHAVEAHHEGVVERAGRVAWKYRMPIALVVAYLVMRIALIAFG